jgi:signal transduction histidine kinase
VSFGRRLVGLLLLFSLVLLGVFAVFQLILLQPTFVEIGYARMESLSSEVASSYPGVLQNPAALLEAERDRAIRFVILDGEGLVISSNRDWAGKEALEGAHGLEEQTTPRPKSTDARISAPPLPTQVQSDLAQGDRARWTGSLPEVPGTFLNYFRRLKTGHLLILNSPLPIIQESGWISLVFSVLAIALAIFVSFISASPWIQGMRLQVAFLSLYGHRIAQGEFEKPPRGGKGRPPVTKELASLEESMAVMASSLREYRLKTQQELEKERSRELIRQRFWITVAHEFRTPLAIIQSQVEGLLDGVVGAQRHEEYLSSVLKETTKLSGLLESLLSEGKLGDGLSDLLESLFPLEPWFTERWEEMKTGLPGLSIRKTFNQKRQTYVRCDPEILRLMLFNYLQNAQRHSLASGQDGKIAQVFIQRDHEGKKVQLGIGSLDQARSPEDLEAMWKKKGTTVDPDGLNEGVGRGLGLSLVRELSEHSGYRVWNESRDGMIVFWISLPLGEA